MRGVQCEADEDWLGLGSVSRGDKAAENDVTESIC